MSSASSLAEKVEAPPPAELGIEARAWPSAKPCALELRAVNAQVSLSEAAAERLAGMVWQRFVPAVYVYRFVLWLGLVLSRKGVSPNSLTYTSLLVALFAAWTTASGHFLAASLLVLASGGCDLLDGIVARATGRSSAWGALLDSAVDRLADALPLIGIAAFYAEGAGLWRLVPVAAIMGVFLLSYVRARAESLGAKLPPLFMRRAERVVLLALALLLGPIDIGLGPRGLLLLIGVSVIGILSYVAALYAVLIARKQLI